ncbi:MAG: pyridoxal phosphate-dependent aminotransferase [Thiotrichales bacterium]
MAVCDSTESPTYATKLDRIQPFHVMRLLAEARALEAAGRDIVHMEVGEPDFPCPQPILDAGIRALQAGLTHYTPALGLPALREAIAAYYQERYGLTISPRRILVTPGASGALQLLSALLTDPGDEWLLADPGYPCNRNLIALQNGRPTGLAVGPESGFQLSAAQVDANWKSGQTRAVLVTTPANPTGGVLTRSDLTALHAVVRSRGGHLVVDEIYQGLTYQAVDHTALALGEDVFVVNSFSKYFGMTGWRLGWLVAPEAAIPDLDKLAQNLFLAASTPAQHAALAAFAPGTRAILEQRRALFEARRDFLGAALRELGFGLPYWPEGAFYLYADVSSTGLDSDTLGARLLHEVGVASTPGRDFGTHESERYLRLAYTTDFDRLEQGVSRIRRWLET